MKVLTIGDTDPEQLRSYLLEHAGDEETRAFLQTATFEQMQQAIAMREDVLEQQQPDPAPELAPIEYSRVMKAAERRLRRRQQRGKHAQTD